ncbi:MAG: hypothetical protein FWC85_04480, partial [Elusimicrobia bacterium]|nr:hypothetical protein [Elusimicrobiota bacterium]
MNKFKKFLEGATALKSLFCNAKAKVGEAVLSLNFVKITSIVIVNCFLLTFVYGQGIAMILEENRSARQFRQLFEEVSVPHSYGRITSANFAGSDRVIIQIQDLHNHPGVQRNISSLIDLFDRQFSVNSVFLEGAFGHVDTSWLAGVQDERLRTTILNAMTDSGRLTGAEHFSISSGRADVIQGLEHKDPYLENLRRFGNIIRNQAEIQTLLSNMDFTIHQLKQTYFNRQQRRIQELSAGYRAGAIDARRYFTLMERYADRLGVDIEQYENISTFMTLLEMQRRMDYARITQELQTFLLVLRERIPYSAYRLLLESTNNFRDVNRLHVYLMRIANEYRLDLSVNFPALHDYFTYVGLSQQINPIELIKEEARFVNEINSRFAVNRAETDVIFIVSFKQYLSDLLTSKITSQDFAFLEANIDRFRDLWIQYVDNRQLVVLEPFITEAKKFYAVNLNRDYYFIQNTLYGIEFSQLENLGAFNGTAEQQVLASLSEASRVDVVITGGFHTEGVSRLLADSNLSYIVITPNVVGGLDFAESVYHRLVLEQAQINFSAIPPVPVSVLVGLGFTEDVARGMLIDLITRGRDIASMDTDVLLNEIRGAETVFNAYVQAIRQEVEGLNIEYTRANVTVVDDNINLTFNRENAPPITHTFSMESEMFTDTTPAVAVREISVASTRDVIRHAAIAGVALAGVTALAL